MQKPYKDTTKIAHLQIFRKENVSEIDFFML